MVLPESAGSSKVVLEQLDYILATPGRDVRRCHPVRPCPIHVGALLDEQLQHLQVTMLDRGERRRLPLVTQTIQADHLLIMPGCSIGLFTSAPFSIRRLSPSTLPHRAVLYTVGGMIDSQTFGGGD
jgi:hypothetical protein